MFAPSHFSLSRIGLGLVCAMTVTHFTFAAEPSAPPLSPAPAAAASAPVKYTVREGDTLDKVIRMHMGNSPLRIEILREAVIQQNPQAFAKGANKFLLANAVLTLPNHSELVQKQLAAVLPPVEAAPPAASTSTYTEDRRKTWVRYP